jgi:hypothetical protein
LDLVADQMIMDFYSALRKYHGNPRDGWYALLRAHGVNGRMGVDNFENVCTDMKFSKAFARKLFSYLDLNGDKDVNRDEWEFLELWDRRDQDEDTTTHTVHSARLGGAAKSQGGASSPAPSNSASQPTSPVKRNAWSTSVAAGGTVSGGTIGDAVAPSNAATVEFHVILTREEHQEYLRRRREFDMQGSPSPARFKPAARGSPVSSPTKNRKSPPEAYIPS